MNLRQALVNYARGYLRTNDWYKWKKINLKSLPEGIRIQENDDEYTQNASLKEQLCEKFRSANESTKIDLTNYYIKTWGGIHRNKFERIRDYALSNPEDLIKYGSNGIASWSKALCIKNPKMFAIYDARVAIALNALQKNTNIENPVLYPLLNSQNNKIKAGNNNMREYAFNNRWTSVDKASFYTDYNKLLLESCKDLNVNLYTIEMLLFSKAVDLVETEFN